MDVAGCGVLWSRTKQGANTYQMRERKTQINDMYMYR